MANCNKRDCDLCLGRDTCKHWRVKEFIGTIVACILVALSPVIIGLIAGILIALS